MIQLAWRFLLFRKDSFLPPFAAALVSGAPSGPSIARNGSSIPQFPREDLVRQHVRRFYTNTNNAGDQSDHRVWSITGRLLHTLQASLLDEQYRSMAGSP